MSVRPIDVIRSLYGLAGTALLLAACKSTPMLRSESECGPGKRLINGECQDYTPVCVEVKGEFRTYSSEALALLDGGITVAHGECCNSAADCERRGRWNQRCVSKTDTSDYQLEAREDWFECLTEANDVYCQCGGPSGAPTCQFTTFENPKFMECYSRKLPNPPPEVTTPSGAVSPIE